VTISPNKAGLPAFVMYGGNETGSVIDKVGFGGHIKDPATSERCKFGWRRRTMRERPLGNE